MVTLPRILSCGCFGGLRCCCCCSLVAQSCPTPWTPWTAAHQAPPSLGFSRQEHWDGLPLPFPGVLNVLKQNKQTHSVTLSLPLKFYGPCHLPGETSIYLGYLFTSFPVTREKAMAPHSSTLASESHGRRSLVGCSPRGR